MAGGIDQVGLGILFSARDMASGPVGLLRRNFTGLQQAVTSGAARIVAGFGIVVAGVTSLRAGLDLLRGSFNLAVTAGQFQQTLVAVGAVTRATTEDMENLTEAAVQAGIRTQFSPREAAEGLQSLATAGLNATAATEVLNPVLDLATGSLGQLGVAGAAETVVGTLNAYQMSASEATRVTDQLLRTTQLTNFQARDFQVGLSRSAAAGAQFNQRFENTLAVMGLLRNANIEASVASTSYREAVRRVFTDQQALEQLRRLGVRSFDAETGAARDAAAVMYDVASATGDMTDEERSAIITRIFGVRGMIAYNAVAQAQTEVLRDGTRVTLTQAEAYNHLSGEIREAEGTATEFSDAVLGTFQGQMVLLTGTIETLQTVVGDTFAKVFRPVVKLVTDTLNAFIRVWQAIPEQARFVVAGLVLFTSALLMGGGALGVVVGGIVLVVALLGELLLVILGVMAAVVLAMAPVLAVWAAMIAAVVAVYYAYRQNLGGIADYVDGWVARVRLAWDALRTLFSGGDLSDAIIDQLNSAENEGVSAFVWGVWRAWQRLQEIWMGIRAGFRSVWEGMAPVFQELQGAFAEVVAAVREVFTALGMDLPTEGYFNLGQTIGRVLGGALRLVVQGVVVLIRFVARLIRIWEGLRPVVMPLLRIWLGKFRLIWGILGPILRVLGAVLYVANMILNPFIWLFRIIEGIANISRRLRGLPETTEGMGADARERETWRTREQGIFSREESRRRTEAGTDRPAAAAAGASDEMVSLLRSIDEEIGGGRGRDEGRRTEIRTTVELDGDVVGESVEEWLDRQEAGEGQTILR